MISCRPKPNIPTPQCAGLGNFYIASIDPAGNFGYVTQNGEQALASVAPEQKYAVLYTVDSSCRLSSVSAPGGVAGSDDQLFDYTILPTADEPIPRFDVASRIPSGGAAITCTTGGRDGFGNYFTCCTYKHMQRCSSNKFLLKLRLVCRQSVHWYQGCLYR